MMMLMITLLVAWKKFCANNANKLSIPFLVPKVYPKLLMIFLDRLLGIFNLKSFQIDIKAFLGWYLVKIVQIFEHSKLKKCFPCTLKYLMYSNDSMYSNQVLSLDYKDDMTTRALSSVYDKQCTGRPPKPFSFNFQNSLFSALN